MYVYGWGLCGLVSLFFDKHLKKFCIAFKKKKYDRDVENVLPKKIFTVGGEAFYTIIAAATEDTKVRKQRKDQTIF